MKNKKTDSKPHPDILLCDNEDVFDKPKNLKYIKKEKKVSFIKI